MKKGVKKIQFIHAGNLRYFILFTNSEPLIVSNHIIVFIYIF